jgi:hypothetical protein
VDDEKAYCNRDARVGDIKGGPGIGVPNVEIEKEKIDHMSIKKSIGQVTQNASKKQCKRDIAPWIGLPPSCEQGCNDN